MIEYILKKIILIMLAFIKRVWNSLFGKKETVAEKIENFKKEVKVVEESVKKSAEEKVTAKEIKSSVKKPRVKKEPKFKASKAAIKLAKENGIDLTKVKGTGKEGSITVSDVKNLIK